MMSSISQRAAERLKLHIETECEQMDELSVFINGCRSESR